MLCSLATLPFLAEPALAAGTLFREPAILLQLGGAPRTVQLRWFLVDPSIRGAGLGKRLLREAVAFCKDCGYAEVILWTESTLEAAARLYQSARFRKTEEKPSRMWGVDLVEEKYELKLA